MEKFNKNSCQSCEFFDILFDNWIRKDFVCLKKEKIIDLEYWNGYLIEKPKWCPNKKLK